MLELSFSFAYFSYSVTKVPLFIQSLVCSSVLTTSTSSRIPFVKVSKDTKVIAGTSLTKDHFGLDEAESSAFERISNSFILPNIEKEFNLFRVCLVGVTKF